MQFLQLRLLRRHDLPELCTEFLLQSVLRQLLRLRRRSEQQSLRQLHLHLHLPLQPERLRRRDVRQQQLLRVQSLQFLRLQSLQFLRLQSLQFVRLQSLQFVRLQSLQFVRLLRLVLERLKISKDARPRRAAHFCRVRHTMEGRREPI